MTREELARNLWTVLTGPKAGVTIRLAGTSDKPSYCRQDAVGLRRFIRMVANVDVEVSACSHLTADVIGPAHVCWARVESRAAVDALKHFLPRPTLVLTEGGVRRVALWALDVPLRIMRGVDYRLEANRRVAHALGAPKKYADPGFRFRVSELDSFVPELYDPGFLKRLWAPDPNAWRRRQQEGLA